MNGNLRSGFREIADGWARVLTFDAVSDRIERLAEWTRTHGPLTPDEAATVQLMIEVQTATFNGHPIPAGVSSEGP